MPELPEIDLYIHALQKRLKGQCIERIRVASPSVLRTFDPPIAAAEQKRVTDVSRLGKRVVLELEDDLFLIIHLMVAGRFKWKERGAPVPRKVGHAAVDFATGTLLLTEAATRKRASIHLVRGRAQAEQLQRGGIESLEATLEQFTLALTRENRTLKRALTDPRIFSGIGNAHSDEILWEAQLSPVRLTRQLEPEEIRRLHEATQRSLASWTRTLLEEAGDAFPEKVTAFHPRMAVHGRFGQPCPRCRAPVQRIVYASNETNYCAQCQTGGRLLADRALSRLLREDWPRTLEELEER
jgi:formamidopyrimidine-DNA glycosylase